MPPEFTEKETLPLDPNNMDLPSRTGPPKLLIVDDPVVNESDWWSDKKAQSRFLKEFEDRMARREARLLKDSIERSDNAD